MRPTVRQRDGAGALSALFAAHGGDPFSIHLLDPRLQVHRTGGAAVPYADTGGAWVAAGPPVGPDAAGAARAFVVDAAAHRRRAVLFGIAPTLARDAGLAAVELGLEPSWDPAAWTETLRSARRLREQLRRARAAGVVVRPLDGRAFEAERPAVEALIGTWLRTRRMPAMGFVVRPDPFWAPGHRLAFAASRRGRLVGLAVARPLPARDGFYLQHLFRDPAAPNGTTDLLVDAAMRAFAAAGARWASLGLAPLARTPHRALAAIARAARPLFDFEGLFAFKLRLRPGALAPVVAAFPEERAAAAAIWDALAAFAAGRPVRFGARALGLRAIRASPGRLPAAPAAVVECGGSREAS